MKNEFLNHYEKKINSFQGHSRDELIFKQIIIVTWKGSLWPFHPQR
jgi:hypothetical protein